MAEGVSTIDEHLGAARTGTTRTARSRRTRTGLVDAIRVELRETGAFTAASVATRAGCAPATFYSHFATKDDALASAFDLVLSELVDLQSAVLTPSSLLQDGLEMTARRWITAQVSFFRAESLVFRAALARLPFHRAIRHAYREAERLSLNGLVEFVIAGQADGSIEQGDPTALAEAVLVLSQGVNNPHMLKPGVEHLHRSSVRSLVAVLAPGGNV